jgi:uncharacterized protein with NRDE domain
VAANRDEYLARPAEGPDLRLGGRFPIAAPRDLQGGGTWLGLNTEGLFAAITNRPVAERDDTRRSRGLLVLDALEASSAREAAEQLVGLPADAYNPFNLLVADGEQALVVVYEGRPELRALEPGAHVIGNADPDDRSNAKVARLLDEVEQVAEQPDDQVVDALSALCRSHDGKGSALNDTCIHAGGYGTRSSTLLHLSTGSQAGWWFADGPPCRTSYEDVTPLLRELGRGGRSAAGDAKRSNV